MTPSRSPPITVLLLALLGSFSCQAAAPVYFDLGGLIWGLLLYCAGVIALPLLTACASTVSRRRVLSLATAFFILGPPAYVVSEMLEASSSSKAFAEDYRRAMSVLYQALAKHCTDNRRVVHRTVNSAAPVTVGLRVSPSFKRSPDQFGAAYISAVMRADSRCTEIGVNHLVSLQDRTGVESAAAPSEYAVYAACGPTEQRTAQSFIPRYELRIGEVFSELESAPYAGSTIERVSIRLLDATSGEDLVEDSMYLLSGMSPRESAVCPVAQTQVVALLRDVFGTNPLKNQK